MKSDPVCRIWTVGSPSSVVVQSTGQILFQLFAISRQTNNSVLATF